MSKNNKKQYKKKSKVNWGVIITLLITVSLIGSLFVLGKLTDPNNQTYTFDLNDRPFTGSETAPVTIVEFGDFKCPACKVWTERVLPQLEQDFIDTNKAKLYFMNYPIIGPDSITAMEAARSVYKQDPNSFWTIYDKMFEYQPAESLTWATPEYLTDLIGKYTPNINIDKVKEDLNNSTYEQDIADDFTQGQNAKVPGTPSLFINGKKVNAFDYKEIKKAIEKGLK